MIKLSHILPPAVPTTDKPDSRSETEETCPRAIIGDLPAGTALHLAIGHQLRERLRFQRGKDGEFGVDDLTIPDPAAARTQPETAEYRSTLIIASTRSRWHGSLLKENDVWLRDHGGVPDVADALRKVDVRYCSEPKDARVLCALLHVVGDEGSGDASCMSEVPGMIVAWDLFGLFAADEEAEAGVEDTKDSIGSKPVPSLLSDTALHDYLSLVSMLRQACEQINTRSDGTTPTLVILEPQLLSRTEIPIVQPTVPLPTRGSDRKKQRHLKLVRGLEWILAPGYAEDQGRRTVVEITKVIAKDDDMDDGRPPDTERYTISHDEEIIATFQRRDEDRAPGKPWLDRAASVYEWVPLQRLLGPGEAQEGISTV